VDAAVLTLRVTVTAPPPHWVCPVHQLELAPDGDALRCAGGELFPVENGIPRFVGATSYAGAFGLQWRRYRLTQLDSFTGMPISEARLRRCLGESLWESLEGKEVLECGCGAGRFTEILVARGARVTSVDLSDAVDANAETCPIGPAHRVAMADIMALPFSPRQFDVVLCLGVIQHTPDSEAAIRALAEHVRPGGSLVIDHYAHSLSWYTKTAPLVRQVLKRLSPAAGIRVTEWIVDLLLPLHAAVRHLPPARMLLTRLSPVQCYYHAFPELDDDLQREWALVDTHDSLTDWYKRFRTVGQIRRSLLDAGLVDVVSTRGGNGVEARGVRPLSSPARG
jgi:2-polyprenyl-3-methyl-5-hydroxy-6-metoxy-1,4-benzoquinol methylase